MNNEVVILDHIRSRIFDPKRTTDMAEWKASQVSPPVPLAVVPAAEKQLGYTFPPLLAAIFTKIGNGGFGPGYGLLGIEDSPYASEYGYDADLGKLGLLGTYAEWLSNGNSPKQLIPLCHWGCGLWSCVDGLQTNHPVIYVGGAGGEYVIHHDTFADWITAWLKDEELFERGENGVELWAPTYQ